MTGLTNPAPHTGDRLIGKVAIVTGAGQLPTTSDSVGIGAAIARLLAKAGAAVVLVDRDEVAARSTADLIERDGGRAAMCIGDVSRTETCERATAMAVTEFGGLDILVNNAAVTSRLSLVDMTDEEWSRVLDINLKGAMLMSRLSVTHMRQHGGGSIVNIGSVAALRGFATPAYAAAKGGMLALTTDTASSYGADGIRANAILPGHVYTPMVESSDNSQRGRMLRKHASPIKTEGTGWDVAWATLFLAGPESAWVTGAVLPVDAGMMISAPLPMFPGLVAASQQEINT